MWSFAREIDEKLRTFFNKNCRNREENCVLPHSESGQGDPNSRVKLNLGFPDRMACPFVAGIRRSRDIWSRRETAELQNG